MKIIPKKYEQTKIETTIYQAKNGSVQMNFGDKSMTLPKEFADRLANDLDVLDVDDYNKFYS